MSATCIRPTALLTLAETHLADKVYHVQHRLKRLRPDVAYLISKHAILMSAPQVGEPIEASNLEIFELSPNINIVRLLSYAFESWPCPRVGSGAMGKRRC